MFSCGPRLVPRVAHGCCRHLTQSRATEISQLQLSTQAAPNKAGSKNKKVFKLLDGTVNKSSPEFEVNLRESAQLAAKYEALLSAATAGGGPKARERHTKHNHKLLVSERLEQLLDPNSDFLEIGVMAGMGMEYGDVPRAGSVSGIGQIHGIYCMILANDATVKGGTMFPITIRKQHLCQMVAQVNRLPCVYVVDSGGAFLPLQAEIFNPGGRGFYNIATASSMDIPQLSIVSGSCTAGGAYIPTMSQEAVIVKDIGTIFLGGPPLVYAALGEVVTPNQLGGAHLHSSISGCTDHFAETEKDAIEIARDAVASFNLQPVPQPSEYEDPLFDPLELGGIIPASEQHTMDMVKVIARIVDGSRFHEFKAMFGSTIITGFAHIQGYLVGIVANNGEITEKAATKASHFIQLCCSRHIPLIFLQNTPPQLGFGDGDSQGGQLRCQAQMMTAVACAKVPKFTVIVGNSFGPANFMMCGRSFDPRFIFTWPNAQICMQEPEQLVTHLTQNTDPKSEAAEKMKTKILQKASAFYSTTRLWDDGIILPHNTRKVLGQCLSIVSQSQEQTTTDFGVIRM